MTKKTPQELTIDEEIKEIQASLNLPEIVPKEIPLVNRIQIGGAHYKTDGGVQHWDMVEQNHMGYLEGCATKYIIRWRNKNGLQDVRKAKHYVVKALDEYMRNGRIRNYLVRLLRLVPVEIKEAFQTEAPAPEYSWAKFCVDNKIPFPENQICIRLSKWETESDLRDIITLIDELIGGLTLRFDKETIERSQGDKNKVADE